VSGPGAQPRISVIKIGGGLAAIPGALDRVCSVVAEASRSAALVVVPGGGAFADAVREFDRMHHLSPDTAHWMALLAMDQYAYVLAERIAGAILVDEAGPAAAASEPPGAAILAPSRWMRAADVLPHTWEATSDSVAAFVAGALDAPRLVLVKPTDPVDEKAVDGCFRSVLPAGMHHTLLGWERIDELPRLLAEPG
jgi:5-(aminomethyl)-3-furanmethanol phosphate kinase